MSKTKIVAVDSGTALSTALSNSTGGETILLSAGDYGYLGVFSNSFSLPDGAAGVTIRSADPDAQAVFSSLDMRGVRGISFEDVTFKHTAQPNEDVYLRVAKVQDSEDISFHNVTFIGDKAISDNLKVDGTPTGFGLQFRDSSNITVEDSEFVGLAKGLRFMDSHDIVIRGTEIHEFRVDGLNLHNVQNALIENNHIHNARGARDSGDHRDAIQMWSTAKTPEQANHNVTFRNNLLDIGDGDYSQGLYISNRPVTSRGKGEDFYFTNIVIENNVIINDQPNYLRVGPTDGLVITGNTLIRQINEENPNKFDVDPRITLDGVSYNVTITDNVTHGIRGLHDRDDWAVSNNGPVLDGTTTPEPQDPARPEPTPTPEPETLPQPEPTPEPAPAPAPQPDQDADVARKIVGGSGNDAMVGGSGNDEIVLRWGNDTATGGAGADTFVFDWRYRSEGDQHTITDLNFAAGDSIVLRFFDGRPITIDSEDMLDSFIARSDVTVQGGSDALKLTLTSEDGGTLGLTLNRANSGTEPEARPTPIPDPEPELEPTPQPETGSNPDPDRKIVGGSGDQTLVGGSGNDELILRWDNDTATGGAGADTFVFDWRYRGEGDQHTITDFDFAEGDAIMLRFFDGRPITIDSEDALASFTSRSDVTATNEDGTLNLALNDGFSGTLDIALMHFDEFQYM